MNKILYALLVTLILSSVAQAANRNQYSPEQPSLLEEILGNSDSDWSVTPIPQTSTHLRGNHRQRYGNNANLEYRHTQISPSVSLITFGHQLQSAGFRVSEHPSFGGVHHVHHGWAHYAGRAIDVNLGTGLKEAYNSSARARFDVLAAQARSSGYTVLWRTAGHYDHMHIQK